MLSNESIFILIIGVALISIIIYRECLIWWNIAKRIKMVKEKIPTPEEITKVMNVFKNQYVNKLKKSEMDKESNDEDPAYGDMYQ